MANPPSHPKRVTPAVERLAKEVESSSCCNPKELVMANETLTHYMGIERILTRIAETIDGKLPHGGGWHWHRAK